MSAHAHLPRLYLAPQDYPHPVAGALWALPPAQARYLGTVLRKQTGDTLRVFNAEMGEWLATLEGVRKDKGSFTLTTLLRAPVTQPELVLAFALLKRDATDLVVRMGTELGVTRFLPLITERTNTHRVNLERLHTIATEAAEQCERLDIPAIDEPQPLVNMLGAWPEQNHLFTAIERAEGRCIAMSANLHTAKWGDGLLIGPEGGLTDSECQMLLNRPFIAPLSLGPLVLRADTAVAAGLALLGHGLRSA